MKTFDLNSLLFQREPRLICCEITHFGFVQVLLSILSSVIALCDRVFGFRVRPFFYFVQNTAEDAI